MSDPPRPAGVVRLYVAISLDGYLATADGSVAWLDAFASTGEDYGYDAMVAGCATTVMGRATYEQVLTFGEWPYAALRTVVWTRSPLKGAPPKTEAFHGPAAGLAAALRARCADGDVWINGGGATARGLLDAGAVDVIELYVMPTLLGDGIRLFPAGQPTPALELVEHRAWPSGVVRLLYRVPRAE